MTPYAAIFAHSLGLWERLGGLSGMADGADQLVGFAQLIAEANGLASVGHIKEKISEMIIHATLVRAALEAAITNCKTGPEGAVFPDELFTNAGKYHAAASYSMMVRHLHDIGGGSILTAPAVADLENPEVGPLLRKYMGTGPGVDGEYRLRLFGVPFGWCTRIDVWRPGEAFVDRQLRGPFARWVHTHRFRAVPGGTEVADEVEWALPLRPLGEVARPLVRAQLERIFDYREAAVRRILAGGAAAG